MEKEKYLARLHELLDRWVAAVSCSKDTGVTDGLTDFEGTITGVLDALYRLGLENLKRKAVDYYPIDLGDRFRGVAFRVTAFPDAETIRAEVEHFLEHFHEEFPGGIRFVVLAPMDAVNRLKASPKLARISHFFDSFRHILGPEDLLLRAGDVYDENRDTAVHLLSLLGRGHSPRVSLSRLPFTHTMLYGRDEQLKELDRAWGEPVPCIITLIAWGGVGKTTLVNHWLNKMEADHYRGAARVYGWSFYSHGAGVAKQSGVDAFLLESLKWFGDPDPDQGSSVDKGRRLARLVGGDKNLLILDGLEPMQYPPGKMDGFGGKLKDAGMAAFLKELAACGQGGLCVITSRQNPTDLDHFKKGNKKGNIVREIQLEHLSHDAGAQLLRHLGVKGSNRNVKAAAKEYDGHALALTLLGQYVKTLFNGDIRQRDKIPALVRERHRGGHARRVMEAYEQWLGDSPELDILYIMGLFDRPVERGALEALETEHLRALSGEDWDRALSHLRAARLLTKKNTEKPGSLDCHPLIREHFAARFRGQNLKGWKEAHKRLYHYYKNLPQNEFPDTLLEMEPLFAAIAHGCRAGLHREALHDVYWKRVLRGAEQYLISKLGAFGSNLSALSHFFEGPWGRPASGLPEADQALVLSWAAFALRAVGRLREAGEPMKAGLELLVKQENWAQAAIVASNLSELMLMLGEVGAAGAYARQSVTHADRSGDWPRQVTNRTTLADALHQSGDYEEAEKWFREAEAIQQERQPGFKYLYGLAGFRYCDLLLGTGQERKNHRQVTERAESALEVAKRNGWLLAISLDYLTLGCARMMTAMEGGGDFRPAGVLLDRAVQGLRGAGDQVFLSRGLLARAECFRLQGKFQRTRDDLKEALEIIESGDMKLLFVDYHLETARLCTDEGNREGTDIHFNNAAALINETGYYRRTVKGIGPPPEMTAPHMDAPTRHQYELLFNHIRLRDKRGALVFIACRSHEEENHLVSILRDELGGEFPIVETGFAAGNYAPIHSIAFSPSHSPENLYIIGRFPYDIFYNEPGSMTGDITRLVSGLNINRDLIPTRQLKLIILCPPELENRIALKAPDFYHFTNFSTAFPEPGKKI